MPASRSNPNITRSRLVLEIASELVGGADTSSNPEWLQAKAVLRSASQRGKSICLFGSSTPEGIHAVVKGEADLAIINPANVLSVAYRGGGIYKTPQPVRAIAVIPSWDQYVLAVRPGLGITRFEEIGEKRLKLRVSMRGMQDHTLHDITDDVAQAAGFSRRDMEGWGGEIKKEASLPHPGTKKFEALAKGEIDAIFDEGSRGWVNEALDRGVTILPLAEATVRKLEAIGYRRAILPKSDFPKLPADVLTLDFSGWTVFCREDADDTVVTQICAALDARRATIPWDGEGPLPVEQMCRETPETPQVVPLHPAAEKFWRQRGYI
jgi:TRAP-type uncharacterized transport system substrate-binding protein